ncbi:hypothetical protein D9M69_499180 [compost metagenome]
MLAEPSQKLTKLFNPPTGSSSPGLIDVINELAVFLRRGIELFSDNCCCIFYSLPPLRDGRCNRCSTSDSATHEVERANGANSGFRHPLNGLDDEVANTNHCCPLLSHIE